MLVMDQFPIRRVILVLLIGANLLSNVGGLVIDTKTNGSKIVLELRQQYANSLGHTTITPNVTGVQVFPDEAKNCRVKGVKQCYRPLVLQNGSPEECYYCQWVCSRYNLSSVDHYNWITTDYVNGSNTFKRYSYTKCVVEIELPDGKAGLASDKNYCDRTHSSAILEVNPHQYLYTWPDNQTVLSVNGTISFRFLLNFTNIHQAETGEKCVPLIVYHYCDAVLQLMCNQNETNMGLYILTSGRSAKLLVEDVLNDDSVPTLQNSFHVGHAIDTNNNLSALYLNGQHVHSLKPAPDLCDPHRFYNAHGLSGILFDFTVYRLALTQRLVNEVYLGRKVSVLPGDECYCPYTHPLFYPPPSESLPWRGDKCSAIENNVTPIDVSGQSLPSDIVDRILDITYSVDNLILSGTNTSWISGETGEARVQISLDRFYHVLGFSVKVDTLPSNLTVRTQQDVLMFSHTCPTSGLLCVEWKNVTLYRDLLLVELHENLPRDSLRTDRLELILDGYYGGVEQLQPYVMRDVAIIADCGCLTNRGECVVEDADTGSYRCLCNEEYEGKYCEQCSDGFTSNGMECIPCDCNVGGSLNQSCDKMLGLCDCIEGVTQSKAGPKCDPYLDKVDPVGFGPIAGGTRLKLGGALLDQVVGINIGNSSCNLLTPKSASTTLYCDTGEAPEEVIGEKMPFSITLNSTNGTTPRYDTGVKFTYFSNPNITSVSRTNSIYSGGLSMTFDGTGLTVIYTPVLLIHVTCQSGPLPVAGTFEQECRHDVSRTYICTLPSLESLSSLTQKCEARVKRQVKANTQPSYSLQTGLKLDGVSTFTNLISVEWLQVKPLTIYPDPVFDKFTEDEQIRTFKIQNGVKPELILSGKHLNLATTVSDYKVSVGKQVEADCYTLTATELRCQLDTTLPPPFDDAPVFQNQPLPLVNVTVGNLAFPLGYIYYHHIVPPSPPPTLTAAEIGGIVAAVIVALVSVTLIVLLLYKRRLNKVQRAQQRMAMTGFTRVDSTNSLQTQVQSILIEQDLSVALFSLLIPESFVTQERIIGQGHFGQVYRGRIFVPGRNINKPVAIKSLKSMGLSAKDVVNFMKEAILMKDFNHMNVLQLVGIVYEPSDPESLPLVVTPLMEKGDLKTLISDEFYEFSAGDLLHFGLQISAGMTYLSSLKFIHRDLRAANCMVDSMFVVKIGDFGLSHDVSESEYYRPQDKSKPLPVKWMALEVLCEGSKYTTQSDVWSFGVLLWELMTRGYQPYADIQNSQIKNYIINGHRLSKPDLVPDKIYDIMTSCWAVEPQGRPTFEELTKVISNLLKQADGSHHGYQTDYTSPLAALDYMNPNSMHGSQLMNNDDWSAIIPLIKANAEDYADTARIEDEDTGSDSDNEPIVFLRGATDQPSTSSLNQELQRMSRRDSQLNDYGLLSNMQDAPIAQASGEQPGASVSDDSDSIPPEIPARHAGLRDEAMSSKGSQSQLIPADQSTESVDELHNNVEPEDSELSSMAFINSLCDSLPTPSLDKNPAKPSVAREPVKSTLSAGSESGASITTLYDEALEVRCPALMHLKGAAQVESMTTVAEDGYLEFETISKSPSSPPQTPENQLQQPPFSLSPISPRSGRNQTWAAKPSSDSTDKFKKPVRKTSSTCLPCEQSKVPESPTSRVSLSMKVPVNKRSGSQDSLAYMEANPVWKSSRPSLSSTLSNPLASISQEETSTELNATANIASDGYLEFDAIGTSPDQSDSTGETDVHTDVETKRRRLHRQPSVEHSLSSPDNLGDENVDNQPGSRLERDEHLRPVARITPMSRQQFDTVVPAPRTKATDAEHTYVNNTVMHNSFEPYENVDFSVSKPHTVQSNQKGAKLPVPQVRSSAPASKKNQTLRVNMEDNPNEAAAESVSSVTSVESVQSKPRIAPSPNTRRKTLQETLNTQVAVDSQVRRYGGLRYMNISKATPDDHDYENSWIFQRKEENDDSSSYQNINIE